MAYDAGLYGNGQGGLKLHLLRRTLPVLPGNTYTADAWYSAYTYCKSHIGGD